MLIGLTGYANSGKDTVAEILVREHGFVRYAFADKLRELLYAMNPTVDTQDEYAPLQDVVDRRGWDDAKRHIPEVREMLQRVGVWHRENISEDFWVRLVKDQITHEQLTAGVVVTDCRFSNESAWVRSWGGAVMRVTRPGVGPVNDHCSEKLDFEADVELGNVGDLDDLAENVRTAVELFS